MTKKHVSAYAYLLLVSIIWGVAAPVIKLTVNELPPLIFLTLRFGMSSLIAIPFLIANRDSLPKTPRNQWFTFIHSVLTIALGLTLLFFGFDRTTALSGSVLVAIGPIFSTIAGAIFLKERVSREEYLGVAIALLGTLITILGPLVSAFPLFFVGSVLGNGLIVLSRMSDAMGNVYAKKSLKNNESASTLTHLSFLISFCFLLPITFAVHGVDQIQSILMSAPWTAYLGVLYMAVMSGTLGYFLYNRAVKMIDLGQAATFTYLTPIWAAPLAFWWFGDKITIEFIIGAIVIALGVIISEHHKKKRLKKKKNKYAHHR